MKDDLIIKNLKKDLEIFFSKKEDILFCYLFGSFACQNFNSKSDVDIAVFIDENKSKDFFETRLKLIADLSKLLKREADVIILNTANSILFKHTILREGELIFARDIEKMVNFELRTMQDYYDFTPFSEAYNKAYIERYLNE